MVDYTGKKLRLFDMTFWPASPRQTQSPALSPMAVHHLHHLHYHRLHLLLLAQYFILNSRLGSSANSFLHRPFPFLPDWLHVLSDHLMISLCSTAGFVCMVC